MSLADWLVNRWIVAHEPSREQIADLFAVVDRDLADAAIAKLSPDWRLGIAGTTSVAEANELHEVVTSLRGDVVRWLKEKHPALCPPGVTP